jgi:hypothetical protein
VFIDDDAMAGVMVLPAFFVTLATSAHGALRDRDFDPWRWWHPVLLVLFFPGSLVVWFLLRRYAGGGPQEPPG